MSFTFVVTRELLEHVLDLPQSTSITGARLSPPPGDLVYLTMSESGTERVFEESDEYSLYYEQDEEGAVHLRSASAPE